MSARDFPFATPWTRQPQIPVGINRNHPLARGLVLAQTAQPGLFEAVRGTLSTGNNVGSSAGPYGRQLDFLRSSSSGVVTKTTGSWANRFSGFVIVRQTDLNVSFSEAFLSCRTAGNQGWTWSRGFAFGVAPNRQMRLQMTHQGVADYPSAVNITGVDNEYVSLGFTDVVSSTVRLFARGAFIDSLAVGSMTSPGSQAVDVGGQGPGASSQYFNGNLVLAFLWDNRALTDTEHAELARNPWALFAPFPRRLFVEAPAGGATNLVIAEALHAHAADNLTLTQQHVLTVADASHAHLADNLTLTQQHTLTLADALHAHAADNVVLSVVGTLAVNDALHAHAADNLALTQTHILTLAEALHTHAADNVVLSGAGMLAVNDALHAHAADNLALTQAHTIAVADAAHAHAADNVALTQQHILAIAEALHAHTADNLTLAIGGTTLAIAEALHAHAADNLALTQLHVLVISDTLHAHLADMLTLELPGAAILHDRILFIRGETRTLVIVADNRTLTVH